MKKILNLILSLSLAFALCFSFSGCKKEPPANQENWSDVTIDKTNFSSYFELDGYLGFEFNNGQGNLSSPWADNFYAKGSGKAYLEHSINNTPFNLDYSNDAQYTLNNFITENDESPQKELKWKAIILKAKQDIIIDWVKFKTYFNDTVENSPIKIQFSIKEYDVDSSSDNLLINNIKTYTLPYGQPEQDCGISQPTIHEEDKFGTVALFREYYGSEIYEWNKREVLVKQGQLFCIEFKGVEQIVLTYSSLTNFEEIEQQTNLKFTFENLSFVGKAKN